MGCRIGRFWWLIVWFFVFWGGMCRRVLFCLCFGCVFGVVFFVCSRLCGFCLCSSGLLLIVFVGVFGVVVLVFRRWFVWVVAHFS